MAKAAAKTVTEDTSLREALEASVEAAENDITETVVENPESKPVETAPSEAPPEVPESTEEKPAATELQNEVTRSQPADKPVASGKEAKPPVDWPPALREKWKELPAEVREKVAARERDVAVMMQETAAARHMAAELVRIAEPYRPLMAAEGVQHPLQAFEGLMKITATLAMGAPQQKAERIAGLVKHYGVDIELLDQALAGSLPAPDPQRTQLEQILEQRLAPVNQLLQRVSQAEQQQGQQLYGQAAQTIEQFSADPKNEFIEYVRNDMADLLELAAARGQTMSLKKAYDLSCANNEEIQQVISQRRPQGTIADKRRAASSLAARGSDQSRPTDEKSIRELLEEQIGGNERIA